MGYRVVVVGATGNVGREMLNILAEREFPIDEIAAVASPRSTGDEIELARPARCSRSGISSISIRQGWDIALFAIGSEGTKIHAPRFAAAGCVVIDNSSLYRMDPDVPLIVPEVNPDAIDGYKRKNIIANPNCSTAQMVVVLKPLHDFATIKRVVVATYQSVSGAGKAGMDGAVRAEPQHLRGRSRDAAQVHQADRLQRHFPISIPSSTTDRPRRNGRWWSRPRRSSIPRSR